MNTNSAGSSTSSVAQAALPPMKMKQLGSHTQEADLIAPVGSAAACAFSAFAPSTHAPHEDIEWYQENRRNEQARRHHHPVSHDTCVGLNLYRVNGHDFAKIEHNIFLDPRFVNEVQGPFCNGDHCDADFRLKLKLDSPCINAGNPQYFPGDYFTDLDGHFRILCDAVDMGAYELGLGDFNCDRQINLDDFAGFTNCMTGPFDLGYEAQCVAFDATLDFDVDAEDFIAQQQLLGVK